jgi:uncharacterized PurR-regulated membrane protein YhhQ (DUF165 family)
MSGMSFLPSPVSIPPMSLHRGRNSRTERHQGMNFDMKSLSENVDFHIYNNDNGLVKSQTSFDRKTYAYVLLTASFVTCLIVADVIGVKLFSLAVPFRILGINSVEHSCGMLTFPVTFLLGDLINEYFGPTATKATVYIGLAMSILTYAIIEAALFLPFLDKPFNGIAMLTCHLVACFVTLLMCFYICSFSWSI